MSSKVSFNFMPFQWSFEDELDDSGILKCTIRSYGWNEKNESIYCNIYDYNIPIWVELPSDIDWTENRLIQLCSVLKNISKVKGYNPVSIDFVNKQKLYLANLSYKVENGKRIYENKKFPFLEVSFRSTKSLSTFVYTLKRGIQIPGLGKVDFKCHSFEASITPVLKLFAQCNLPSSNWIRCKGIYVPQDVRESSKTHEYMVSYKDLVAVPESEANTMPIVYPRILSFDNEAYSISEGSMPKSSKPSDKVFMIGATVINQVGRDKSVKKYLLYLKEQNADIPDADDYEVRRFRCEADLYVGFKDLIQETNPDVIIGYNIFGWDIQYMYDRAFKCFVVLMSLIVLVVFMENIRQLKI